MVPAPLDVILNISKWVPPLSPGTELVQSEVVELVLDQTGSFTLLKVLPPLVFVKEYVILK